MKLEIRHKTRYYYEQPAVDSVNEVRLTPRTNYRQSCYHHVVTVEPTVGILSYEDYFGNRVTSFSIGKPHKQLTINTHSIVVTQDQEPREKGRLSLGEELARLNGPRFQDQYAEFVIGTPNAPLSEVICSYAEQYASICKVGSVAIRCVSQHIYESYAYEPGTTNVNTTSEDMLELKKGVCQDFSQLMLVLCRASKIPARYVSGYHFVGHLRGGEADFEQASHAWVEALVPGVDWLGFDPTNNGTMTWRYVTLGHGRDYRDIVPIKGPYKGGLGKSAMEVEVDVRKIDEEATNLRTTFTRNQTVSVNVSTATVITAGGAP